MNSFRLAGVILIVAGVLGWGYGSFSYTRQTHHAAVGPLDLSLSERETVSVPAWAGGAAIALGIVLLVVSGRRNG